MKLLSLIALMATCSTAALSARAEASYANSFTGPFQNGGFVPDGNLLGIFDSRTITGQTGLLHSVTINLNIVGGFNGDLYAYVSYNGILVPLINRVGRGTGNEFGSGDSGFNVQFSSLGAGDIHWYGTHANAFNADGQLTGTWQPDGRLTDPLGPGSAYDTAARTGFESLLDQDPNGTWILFLADLSAGDQSRLVSWEIDTVTGVHLPEPSPISIAMLGGVAIWLLHSRHRSRKVLTSLP